MRQIGSKKPFGKASERLALKQMIEPSRKKILNTVTPAGRILRLAIIEIRSSF
jgi:hypothetical protein